MRHHRRLHRPPHPRPAPPARSGSHRRTRRFERARPGELVHIHVKKLGRIPDGCGHKVLGRAAGSPIKDRRNGAGYACLHTALDDHSRLACTEDLPDEKAATCTAFLQRAAAWFAARGITVERVLTDNAWSYTKNTWRQTCRDLGVSPRFTPPWRPQTNGKVEHFHRTLLNEWAAIVPTPQMPDARQRFPTGWTGTTTTDPTPNQRPHPSQPRHQLSEQHT